MKLLNAILFVILFSTTVRSVYSQPIKNDKPMKNKEPKTVVFIHGAFVNSQCWDEWEDYFKSKGYNVLTPPWPYKNASAIALRSRQPDAHVASIRLEQLLNHYDSIVKNLPEKPIVIGHSLGGLLVQLLIQRGNVAGGIAIHSVPPKGIMTFDPAFYRATGAALGFFTSTKKSYLMSFKKWQYAFTNGMSLEDQRSSYNQFAVPESKLVLRDGLTKVAAVDFKKPHAPLLLTSGSIDHAVPASLNKKNYNHYKKYKNNSITELKEFPGRNHFVLGQSTWKEDADYILNWIDKNISETKVRQINSTSAVMQH